MCILALANGKKNSNNCTRNVSLFCSTLGYFFTSFVLKVSRNPSHPLMRTQADRQMTALPYLVIPGKAVVWSAGPVLLKVMWLSNLRFICIPTLVLCICENKMPRCNTIFPRLITFIGSLFIEVSKQWPYCVTVLVISISFNCSGNFQ